MKKIFILLTVFYFLLSNTSANENIFIVAKINNKILTNFDLKRDGLLKYTESSTRKFRSKK